MTLNFVIFALAFVVIIVWLATTGYRLSLPRDDAIVMRARKIRAHDPDLAYKAFLLVGEARRCGLHTEYASRQLDRAEGLLKQAEDRN